MYPPHPKWLLHKWAVCGASHPPPPPPPILCPRLSNLQQSGGLLEWSTGQTVGPGLRNRDDECIMRTLRLGDGIGYDDNNGFSSAMPFCSIPHGNHLAVYSVCDTVMGMWQNPLFVVANAMRLCFTQRVRMVAVFRLAACHFATAEMTLQY